MTDVGKIVFSGFCGFASVYSGFFKPMHPPKLRVGHVARAPEKDNLALAVLFFSSDTLAESNSRLNQQIEDRYDQVKKANGLVTYSQEQWFARKVYQYYLEDRQVEPDDFPSLREQLITDLRTGCVPYPLPIVQAINWISMHKSSMLAAIDTYDVNELQGDFLSYGWGLAKGCDQHHAGFFHNLPVLIDQGGVVGGPSGSNRVPVTAKTRHAMTVMYGVMGRTNLELELHKYETLLKRNANATVIQTVILTGFPVCFSVVPACNNELGGFYDRRFQLVDFNASSLRL